MPQRHTRLTALEGFTLIEHSMVLVIIGLIVGGVLVGRDLIRAAEIRATISQIEKYNTSVYTFKIKYNAMPGDILPQAASNIGMTGPYLLNGYQGVGDGNDIIEDGLIGIGGSNDNLFAGEISEFWAHLTWANLIDGGFGAGLTTGTGVPPVVTAANLNQYMPPAKLRQGMSITVFSGGGYNFYAILPIAGIVSAGSNIHQYALGSTGLNPLTASNIDVKIDDGQPQTGLVRAIALAAPIVPSTANTLFSPYGMTQPSTATTATAQKCVIGAAAGAATDTYNLSATSGGYDLSCGLALRFN